MIPFTVAGATDVGRVRSLNEDSFVAESLPTGDGAVLLVADGVGGHDAGERASGLAKSLAEDVFLHHPDVFKLPDLGDVLERSVQAMNEAVRALPTAEAPPASTCTLCVVRGARWWAVHLGDSRLYHIRQGQAEQVSHDHSLVADAVRAGSMTEEEARRSPLRNQITRALGIEPAPPTQQLSGDLNEGDVLLLCSDGLSEYVDDSELGTATRQLTNLDTLCATLIEWARERGGHDNITAVAFRYGAPRTVPPTGEHPTLSSQRAEVASRRRPSWAFFLGLIAVSFVGLGAGLVARSLRQRPSGTKEQLVPYVSPKPSPLKVTPHGKPNTDHPSGKSEIRTDRQPVRPGSRGGVRHPAPGERHGDISSPRGVGEGGDGGVAPGGSGEPQRHFPLQDETPGSNPPPSTRDADPDRQNDSNSFSTGADIDSPNSSIDTITDSRSSSTNSGKPPRSKPGKHGFTGKPGSAAARRAHAGD
ncbi:MAG: protein phosphatase 2C domain-containing protein [Armatimonas sp.]